MTSVDLSSVIGSASKDVNRIFKGKSYVIPGEDTNLSDVKLLVPTSSYLLNKLLSGGVPVGRVIEIYGEPSHGKSSIAQHIMVGFQRFPGLSILLDSEFTWDRSRAIKMGHDNSRHIYLQVDCLERGVEVIDSLITRLRMPGKGIPNDMPIVIVWDTISNSPPEAELDDVDSSDDGDETSGKYKHGMCDKPRQLRELERKWSMKLPQTMCSLVFVSQTYTGPSKGRGPQQKTSGGGAIKFWASKRLKVWRESVIDYPAPQSGFICSVQTVKDKLAPPYRTVQLPLLHITGIHPGYELVNFLLDYDKAKTFLYKEGRDIVLRDYPEAGKELAFTIKDLPNTLEQFPEVIEYMQAAVDEVWSRVYG